MKKHTFLSLTSTVMFSLSINSVMAAAPCPNISHAQLSSALNRSILPTNNVTNGGLDFNMWATVVSPDTTVCAVTKSGTNLNDQWLGSRQISVQKATTAINFSLPNFALSTANLFAPAKTGAFFGVQVSNPVNPAVAYAGDSDLYGTENDPMIGQKQGGFNVFGGGLALYDSNGNLVGAVGVSGDTPCADHNVAMRVRNKLGFNNVPNGVNNGTDNIVFDSVSGNNNGELDGFEHPECGNNEVNVNTNIQSFFDNN